MKPSKMLTERELILLTIQLARIPVGEELTICTGLIHGGMSIEKITDRLIGELALMFHRLSGQKAAIERFKQALRKHSGI